MTTTSLDRRLRKLEAARSGNAAFFAAWGRTADEASTAVEIAGRIGSVRPGDEAIPFVWPHAEPMPPSRWITFGRGSERNVPDLEFQTMHDLIEGELIRRERAAILASGEDSASLDDTDVRIRMIRRDDRDAGTSLRLLEMRMNPDPEIHWPESTKSGGAIRCTCDRCRAGETTPIGAHRRHEEQIRAWRNRYLPAEEQRAS